MRKIKTAWFMTPLGLTREVLWVKKNGKIAKRKIIRLKKK
jgi:hypothetical protein